MDSNPSLTDRVKRTMIGSSHKKKLDPLVKKNNDVVMQTFMIHRPICCKKHDFSRESWWMIDFENYNGDQGATGLMKRCMKAYDWNNVDSVREILKAYRQFLTLKSELDTTTIGAMLLPSCLVDQMWYQHSLNHETYCHDMRMLYGRPILRNPNGAKLDAPEATKQMMQARYDSTRTRTKTELVKRFGLENLNHEVWGWLQPHTTDECLFEIEDESKGGGESEHDDDMSWDSGDYVPPTIGGKRKIPSIISYNSTIAETDTTLSDVSDSLDDNLSEQKKKNERVPLLFITMSATGGKVEVAAKPKKALKDIFKMYSQHIQYDLKDLRFTINGQLYDTDSRIPVSKLNIVRGNTILVAVHDNSKANRKCTIPVNK